MWTRNDNGSDVEWRGAVYYCRNLSLGGYSGWRLPAIEELKKIYDPRTAGHFRGGIHGGWLEWSATPNGSAEAWILDFRNGRQFSGRVDQRVDKRALCVRRARE